VDEKRHTTLFSSSKDKKVMTIYVELLFVFECLKCYNFFILSARAPLRPDSDLGCKFASNELSHACLRTKVKKLQKQRDFTIKKFLNTLAPSTSQTIKSLDLENI